MKPFTFHRPGNLVEALGLLEQHGGTARVMAGGQSLLLELKERRAQPTAIVLLTGLHELSGWQYGEDGGLELGPTTTYAELVAAAGLRGWHREIAAVAGNLADRPVRTMGTVGGALCQAEARFDMPALVVGAGASVDTLGPEGARTRDAAELFAPGGGSALQPGEILTRVRFPSADAWTGLAFEKFRVRQFDAALASVVCALDVGPDGRVARARLTVGAATPAPTPAPGAADLVVGRTASQDMADVAAALADEVAPAASAVTRLGRYQRELLPVLARQAIDRAFVQSGS